MHNRVLCIYMPLSSDLNTIVPFGLQTTNWLWSMIMYPIIDILSVIPYSVSRIKDPGL